MLRAVPAVPAGALSLSLSLTRWLRSAWAIIAILLVSCGGGGDSSSSPQEKPVEYAPFAGIWRGNLAEATSGSFGETVLNLQQSGGTLAGTWTAWFNSGAANGGTISGTVAGNAETADFRLTSTGEGQCPFTVTVSLRSTEAQGTYASVNCPILMTGTVHVYKDGAGGPTYIPALPGTPRGVVATPGNGQVTVRWSRVAGASSHNLYRSTTPGFDPATWTKVLRVSEPATVSGLTSGIPYYFVVTAENMSGEGSPSAEASAMPSSVPNAPTGVVALPGDGEVTVTWPDVSDAIGYNLYWSTSPGQAFSGGTKVAGVTSGHILTGLTNAATYFIALTAINAAGESAPSAEARATPYATLAYNFDDGTLQGWTASGSWAVVSATVHSGFYSVSDSPAGSYANNSDSWLLSPPLDLPGKYVYVANYWSNNVSQYAIGANGALRPMAPATVAAGELPASVVVHPSGRYTYVANYGGTVSQYTVGASGALTPMAPATVAAGASAESVAVDPSGRFAYVANSDYVNPDTVLQYAVGANGALTPMAPATVATGEGAASVVVDPSGKYVYVANRHSDTVSQYTIGANGALTPMVPASVATASSPYSVTVHPSGKYAYVANWGSNNVSQFAIGADGALAPMAPATVAAGAGPRSVTVDPSGRYAYVPNSDFTNSSVSQYAIGANGALTPMVPAAVAAGGGPHSVTIDPSGRYAYAANYYTDDVSQFTVGANGALTPVVPATVAAGMRAISVIVDPSGTRSPVLTFWHRYSLESGYDWGRVEISTDAGASWATLRTFNGSQTSWTPETVSLQGYSGPAVLIRFRLITDGSGTQDGWYLDDIVISR